MRKKLPKQIPTFIHPVDLSESINFTLEDLTREQIKNRIQEIKLIKHEIKLLKQRRKK